MMLNNLDAAQISSMRTLRRQALINQTLKKDVSPPDMKVPKLRLLTIGIPHSLVF